MQTLKDHFNNRARAQRKRRQAERQRDEDFIVFLLFLLLLSELERQHKLTPDRSDGPHFGPG